MTMRLSTANTYSATIANLLTRQNNMSSLQNQLSSGQKINQASDDPAGAALAERSATRIASLAAGQSAVAAAKDSMSTAESTLGSTVTLLQSARSDVISAGNGSYSAANLATLAQQLSDVRDQVVGLANQQDSSGQYVFSGQGSTGAPFVSTSSGVVFNGTPGQQSAQASSVPHSLDGNALFMAVPTGNGVFAVTPAAANTGSAWTDAGEVTSPSALTGDNYSISFSQLAGNTVYSVTNTTTGAAVATSQPYVAGQSIQFDGQSVAVSGTPASGDQFNVQPSTRTSVFTVLDQAIAGLKNPGASSSQVMQTVQQALAGLDTSMNQLQAGRSQAGEWMNRADSITSSMSSQSLQMTTAQSAAQDTDMVATLSNFQNEQTAYQVALKTYAQVQQLSLFQYINN